MAGDPPIVRAYFSNAQLGERLDCIEQKLDRIEQKLEVILGSLAAPTMDDPFFDPINHPRVKTCPLCAGTCNIVQQHADVVHNDYFRVKKTCPICDGEGVIPDRSEPTVQVQTAANPFATPSEKPCPLCGGRKAFTFVIADGITAGRGSRECPNCKGRGSYLRFNLTD